MFFVGTATTDITAFHPGTGMMGYGMHWNTVESVETPMLARAFFIREEQSVLPLVYVVCDMAFITPSIRNTVLKRLRRQHPDLPVHDTNLVLTAQHTHSGPGGYSHYGLYNISIPGFVPQVWDAIVTGIVEAIVEASQNTRPARLYFHSGHFPEDVPVAFNRSLKAYLRNPEAKDLGPDQTHLAVDREMRLLRIDGADGEQIGAINWFGVHSTSVHNDNHQICWDNKGYAADMMEEKVREMESGKKFVGAFAQGAAGDVTPNYVWDKKKKWTRGPKEDDFESAREIGRLQFEQAWSLYEEAVEKGVEVEGGLGFGLLRTNLSEVECDPDFTDGVQGMETARACHGVSFFTGTVEGPGMDPTVGNIARLMSPLVKASEFATLPFRSGPRRMAIRHKYRFQAPKAILFESGERRILGTRRIRHFIVPAWIDKNIRYLKRLHPNGWRESKPWVPEVLPLQIVRLGNIALVNIPAEITTIAAQRLESQLEQDLAPGHFHRIVLAPYTNAYCGYITTHQEYDRQDYEGGHTVFGKWTLAGFQTKFRQLATEFLKEKALPQAREEAAPVKFTSEDLQSRTYAKNTF